MAAGQLDPRLQVAEADQQADAVDEALRDRMAVIDDRHAPVAGRAVADANAFRRPVLRQVAERLKRCPRPGGAPRARPPMSARAHPDLGMPYPETQRVNHPPWPSMSWPEAWPPARSAQATSAIAKKSHMAEFPKQQELHPAQMDEMINAVTEAGLTVQQYNAIQRAYNDNAQIAAAIDSFIEEAQ